MKNTYFLLLALLLSSCSPFKSISKQTEFSTTESGYIKLYNSEINLKFLTFGDFKYAINNKDYKSLKKNKSDIKDILVYGKTIIPPYYEFYILMNPQSKEYNADNYTVADTTMQQNNFVVLISNNADPEDCKFLLNNISIKND